MTEPPFLTVMEDGTLLLTIAPEDLTVCDRCPYLHVRVVSHVTPQTLRQFARRIRALAHDLEVLT